MECINCRKETLNPKFCSRSCSASHNNVKYPKRKKKSHHCKCGKEIDKRSKTCIDCKPSPNKGDITLAEAIYHNHHRSSAFALVRARARKCIEEGPCQNCGYSLHTEVCHIRPIKNFPEDTKLSIINDRSNLLRLCPNCHWEFDQGKSN